MVRFTLRKALAVYTIAFCVVVLSACMAAFNDGPKSATGSTTAVPGRPDELAGRYTATGTNADGSNYSAEVEVIRVVGENYYVVQRFDDDVVFQGPAEVRGGKLRWDYSRVDGIAIYDIDPSGALEGRWGTSENALTGTETWQRR